MTTSTATNYIQRYLDWTSKISIAPKEYNEMVALAHLSALVNRNAYIPLGYKRIYPNLFIIILGKSRISKKTTATEDIGKEKIFSFADTAGLMLPDDSTPQKLFQLLAKRTDDSGSGKGMMYVDEIGGFLSKLASQEYMQGGKDFLCTLYNNPELKTKATLKDDILTIKNAYLTILGNTTTDRLLEVLKKQDITSGFALRFLYIEAPPPINPYVTGYEPDADTEKDDLIKYLTEFRLMLHEHPIRMKLSDEADAIYIEYQKYIDLEIANNGKECYAELPNQLLKIAMLYELSTLSTPSTVSTTSTVSTLEISKNSMLNAKRIIESCKVTFGDTVDRLTNEKLAQRILEILSTTPQTVRDIQRHIKNVKAFEIGEAITRLKKTGLAEEKYSGDPNNNKVKRKFEGYVLGNY